MSLQRQTRTAPFTSPVLNRILIRTLSDHIPTLRDLNKVKPVILTAAVIERFTVHDTRKENVSAILDAARPWVVVDHQAAYGPVVGWYETKAQADRRRRDLTKRN